MSRLRLLSGRTKPCGCVAHFCLGVRVAWLCATSFPYVTESACAIGGISCSSAMRGGPASQATSRSYSRSYRTTSSSSMSAGVGLVLGFGLSFLTQACNVFPQSSHAAFASGAYSCRL